MEKFWVFKNISEEESTLYISGEILSDIEKEIDEKYFELENSGTAPKKFREELKEYDGKKITVYIDSYGGDVFAASEIYTMLKEHNGQVIVKIPSIAASAASVIAMAGEKVYMSNTAVMMIHNPSTVAMGDHNDMEKAAEILETIKKSIINAYKEKTGLSEEEISDLMEKETWFDAETAIEKGFCDGYITEISQETVKDCIALQMRVYNSVKKPYKIEDKPVVEEDTSEEDEQRLKYLKLKMSL